MTEGADGGLRSVGPLRHALSDDLRPRPHTAAKLAIGHVNVSRKINPFVTLCCGSVIMRAMLLHAKPEDDILPLEGWRYLMAWDFPFWGVLPVVLVAGAYLWGVRVLHRRGDRWPLARTISFVIGGTGLIAIANFSFLGVYDSVLFWSHMVQHMLLNMVAPVFLVFGAPVTLMFRTLPPTPRRILMRVVHSLPAKILLFPPLTTALMIASPFVLYTTGLYEFTLRDDLAHDLLHVWFVTIGCMFFFPLLGVDPVPMRLPYPLRFLLFLLSMPGHAFLGVIVMGSTKLIAEEWYLSFNRDWPPSPLYDQQLAGGLLWGTGDLTMMAGILTIFVQWYRDSQREARRIDRALDREEAAAAKARYDSDDGATSGGSTTRSEDEGEA